MIVVDTSVWVAFFRGRDHTVVTDLGALLDADEAALAAPVRVELLAGVKRDQQRRLARLLSALPSYRPTDDTWERMERWAMQAGGKGLHFGVGDLLIAAIAADRGLAVWTLDSDFAGMESLGFVELYAPASTT